MMVWGHRPSGDATPTSDHHSIIAYTSFHVKSATTDLELRLLHRKPALRANMNLYDMLGG